MHGDDQGGFERVNESVSFTAADGKESANGQHEDVNGPQPLGRGIIEKVSDIPQMAQGKSVCLDAKDYVAAPL